jgi:hypothetical protein
MVSHLFFYQLALINTADSIQAANWTSSSSRTKVSGGDQTDRPLLPQTH